jgi:TRAP-type C4-dicarboxylate transport system permease small subunit
MKILKATAKVADVFGYASGWMVPCMMVLVAIEVFTRYVLHNPAMVADEFSAYMLVALSYMGLAYTWRRGGHIRITLLVSRLPVKVASWIRLFGLTLSLFFLIGITFAGYRMISYALMINLRSETWLTFPLFWPQLTVFVGFFLLMLTIFAEIVKVVDQIRSGQKVGEHIQ